LFESQRLKLLHEDVVVASVALDRQARLLVLHIADNERPLKSAYCPKGFLGRAQRHVLIQARPVAPEDT
jgi:hypothetical protein